MYAAPRCATPWLLRSLSGLWLAADGADHAGGGGDGGAPEQGESNVKAAGVSPGERNATVAAAVLGGLVVLLSLALVATCVLHRRTATVAATKQLATSSRGKPSVEGTQIKLDLSGAQQEGAPPP